MNVGASWLLDNQHNLFNGFFVTSKHDVSEHPSIYHRNGTFVCLFRAAFVITLALFDIIGFGTSDCFWMVVVSHLFAVVRPSGRSVRSRCSRITGPMFIFTGFVFLFCFCGRASRFYHSAAFISRCGNAGSLSNRCLAEINNSICYD